MTASFEPSEFRFWMWAYIAVVGGIPLFWYLVTLNLMDGRDWVFLSLYVLLVVSIILGGIASLIGRCFTHDRREQNRLFNTVFLSCCIFFGLVLPFIL